MDISKMYCRVDSPHLDEYIELARKQFGGDAADKLKRLAGIEGAVGVVAASKKYMRPEHSRACDWYKENWGYTEFKGVDKASKAGDFDKEQSEDNVNNPKHYTSHQSGIECIQITEHMGFNLGNAIKYIWRADLKNDAIEDMEKAIWYIKREIDKRNAHNR